MAAKQPPKNVTVLAIWRLHRKSLSLLFTVILPLLISLSSLHVVFEKPYVKLLLIAFIIIAILIMKLIKIKYKNFQKNLIVNLKKCQKDKQDFLNNLSASCSPSFAQMWKKSAGDIYDPKINIIQLISRCGKIVYKITYHALVMIIVFCGTPLLVSGCSNVFRSLGVFIGSAPSPAAETTISPTESSKYTLTPTPVPLPTVALAPTVVQAEQDYSEDYFHLLFSEYFGGFVPYQEKSIDTAIQSATEIISITWLTTPSSYNISWPFEQMDIYGQGSYSDTQKYESHLRDDPNSLNQFIAGCSYVEATDNAMKSNYIQQERTLGLACLRGCDLLINLLRSNSLPQKNGMCYNHIAYLLRHMADELYGSHSEKAFTLYTFAYICYQMAAENGYRGTTLEADQNEMLTEMNNHFYLLSKGMNTYGK